MYKRQPYSGTAAVGLWQPNAVTLENGNLVITAQPQNGQAVSGGLAHQRYFTYGKIELRLRTDADAAAATSAVVQLEPQSQQQGRVSLYETGPGRSPFKSVVFYEDDTQKAEVSHLADGTQWQLMALEWRPDTLRLFRNSQLVATFTDPKVLPQGPHRVSIRLEALKNTLAAPVRLYVDYVRLYEYR